MARSTFMAHLDQADTAEALDAETNDGRLVTWVNIGDEVRLWPASAEHAEQIAAAFSQAAAIMRVHDARRAHAEQAGL